MKTSSLKYFFTYGTEIPDGIGFGLFQPWHLLWIFVCVVFTVFFLYIYAGAGKKRRKLEFIIAFSMPAWILIRTVYILIIHENLLYELPLHLCSISGILCLLHCITGWEWAGQVLYALGLPGTIFALVFPDWIYYPAVHFVTVEGFCFHAGIVVYVSAMLYSHKIVPDLKKIWQVILFLFAVVTPVYFFDRTFRTNYMFVNWPAAGSPLELLARYMGNPGYLSGYAVLAFICILLMYALYHLPFISLIHVVEEKDRCP